MFFFNKSKPSDTFLSEMYQNQGIIHKVCNLYADTAEDRKDLFQEMLLQLWKAYPKFEQGSKISTWMYRVCLNTALSNLRKTKIGKSFFSLDSVTHEPWFDDAHVFDQNEELRLLHKAISELTEVERAIILLYLEENSYEEIVQIAGISVSYVGVKINRIKSKLEAKIKSSTL